MKMHQLTPKDDSKLVVVALEGCHGCGKTALVEEFEAQGYRVLDEAFMDMPAYALHPQSLLMETSWVCSWFERVLRIADRVRKETSASSRKQVRCLYTLVSVLFHAWTLTVSVCYQVYIADRSPYSAVLYSANGHLLEPVIREQMREVEQHANMQFYTVHVQVERELLWQRILARLDREPERYRYNEHKQEWMDETLAFYNGFMWDLTVTNDKRTLPTIVENISQLLIAQDENFRLVYERTKLLGSDSSVASTDSDCESLEALSPHQPPQRSIISFNNFDL